MLERGLTIYKQMSNAKLAVGDSDASPSPGPSSGAPGTVWAWMFGWCQYWVDFTHPAALNHSVIFESMYWVWIRFKHNLAMIEVLLQILLPMRMAPWDNISLIKPFGPMPNPLLPKITDHMLSLLKIGMAGAKVTEQISEEHVDMLNTVNAAEQAKEQADEQNKLVSEVRGQIAALSASMSSEKPARPSKNAKQKKEATPKKSPAQSAQQKKILAGVQPLPADDEGIQTK